MRIALPVILCFFLAPSLAQDFSAFQFRELGPYRGGRVTTVAGTEQEPGTFYLGATGGGIWKTTDYGTSWQNVSDGFFSTPSIGAIAVAQNDANIVYAGTGTDGLRSNIIEGKGIYKSIDAGKTWSPIGLENTGQIGAVRIHPFNHNIVYVAAIGKAFQANSERGIYKTLDGGKTWRKIYFLSNAVGFSDIEMLPTNPDILFASAWKARRTPWTIDSGGEATEAGVFKSMDGGETWEKITKGLPKKLIGKVDLAVTPADSRIVYALVEAPDQEGGLYKSVDQGQSFELVSNEKGIRTRPFYYTNVRVDPKNAQVVYVLATGYFKSEDGGKKWKRVGSPHGDNHDMWINPKNPDLFIQANDGGANVTLNGGKSWSTQFNQPTSEIYQVEVDDQYPYWVYGGQQDNYTTVAVPSMPPYGLQAPGIGYIINTGGCETGPAVPKPGDANIVYANCKGRFTVFDKRTGTERSYYVGAANMYGHNPKELKYRFQRVSPVHVSPHNPSVIYHCSQYVHKTTDEGKSWETISPDLTAFEEDKQVISGMPITRDITGEEFYSTIYAIRESPVTEGLLWVGANDGPVHVTTDGGANWKNVTPKALPPGGRVDAVEPSPHDANKAYIAVLRYQLGDRKPYIYKTENQGQSWRLITTGIPNESPVRVVREDPERPGLLYAGSEHGMYISFNDGASWQPFQQNLPVTPITDLKVKNEDIVMSTMGRGFWMLDDLSAVRQYDENTPDANRLFKPRPTVISRMPSGSWASNTPKYPRPAAIINYFLSKKPGKILKLEIRDSQDRVVNAFLSDTTNQGNSEIIRDMSTGNVEFLVPKSFAADSGYNRFMWDMKYAGPWDSDDKRRYQNGPMVAPGTYKILLTVDGVQYSEELKLEIDPRIIASGVTDTDAASQLSVLLSIRNLRSEVAMRVAALEDEQKTIEESDDQNETQRARLEQLKKILAEIVTKDGIYEKPMLKDQLSYLYFMLNGATQAPGKDAYDRLEELKQWWERIKSM